MDIVTSVISGAISPATIEEICFRGLLFIVIFASSNFLFNKQNKKHDWLGIVSFLLFSSIFFGYLHVASETDIQNIGSYIVAGCIYSLIYLITRDLKVPVITHFLWNFLNILNDSKLGYITLFLTLLLILTAVILIFINGKKI